MKLKSQIIDIPAMTRTSHLVTTGSLGWISARETGLLQLLLNNERRFSEVLKSIFDNPLTDKFDDYMYPTLNI